ncbi:MAG: ABC transporter permease [Acetobacteraceae bacterium]
MSITLPDSLHPSSASPRLVVQAGRTTRARTFLLAQDVIDGTRLWRLAFALGWLDIKLRYRGSVLGPFWLTLSTGAMVGALGVLYSTLFKTSSTDYIPFFALSQVLWTFVSVVILEGCTCFTLSESVIRSVRMPFFVHAIRSLVRNALVLAHNVLVVVVVFAIYRIWPGWHALLALPGLVLWIIDGLAVSMLLGAVCARYRDIPPIIASLMTIAFFVTPVMWQPKQIGKSLNWLLAGNPFFDVLEVVRAPLLGTTAGSHIWIAALVFSAVLCATAWVGFAHARARIAFWI